MTGKEKFELAVPTQRNGKVQFTDRGLGGSRGTPDSRKMRNLGYGHSLESGAANSGGPSISVRCPYCDRLAPASVGVAVFDNPIKSDRYRRLESEQWLTSPEAASFLRVSVATLRNLASNGRVPFYKFGRSNRYRMADLVKMLLSNKKGI